MDIDVDLITTQIIAIDLVDGQPINVDLTDAQPIEVNIVDKNLFTVNVADAQPIEVTLADIVQVFSVGDVESVNGQTGIVVLDYADVGADPVGSATQALVDANIYTDQEIASLTFVASIVPGAGVAVDNSDPQNPIVSATALPQEIYGLENQETTASFVYVGYIATAGDWYIYRRTRSNNLREYAFGISNYQASWSNRATLIYS